MGLLLKIKQPTHYEIKTNPIQHSHGSELTEEL